MANFQKALEVELGMASSRLALEIGVSQGSFTQWRRTDGTAPSPAADKLGLFAKFLRVDLWMVVMIIQLKLPIPAENLDIPLENFRGKPFLAIDDMAQFQKKLETESGLSYNKLAAAIGVSQASLTQWRRTDGSAPSIGADKLGLIANYLGLDLWMLVMTIQLRLPIPKNNLDRALKILASASDRDIELLDDGDRDVLAKAQVTLAKISLKQSKINRSILATI